jgi:hypothetical protein
VKPCLSGSGSGAEVLCYAKVCKTPPRVNRDLKFSQEIVTNEAKGWLTKKFSSKRGRLPREQMHHTPSQVIIAL